MKKIVVALLFFSAASPAFSADAGRYAGVALAHSNMGAAAQGRSSDNIYGLVAGYRLSKGITVETQYTGGRKYESAPVNGRPDAFGLTAVGILPVFSGISLYGKLGFANTNASLAGYAFPVAGARRTAATYGLGALYNVTSNLGLRLGWDQHGTAVDTGPGNRQDYGANNWTCGAVFKF